MRASVFIFLLFIFCLSNESCKKHSSCVSSGGGTGGTGSITIIPEHANNTAPPQVDSCMVYIKYGTLNTPANGIYDDSQKCIITPPDTIPKAIFTGLQPGLYYFYANGYHTALAAYVKGQADYTMCSEQSVTIYLPTYQYITTDFIW